MQTRRSLLQMAGAGILTGLPPGPSTLAMQDRRPESANEKSPAQLMTPDTHKALERAIRFLKSSQLHEGSFAGAFGTNGFESGVAVTSLAGLAFLTGGHVPGDGVHGDVVQRATRYVLSKVQTSGLIALSNGSVGESMYGHGFSLLFLSQVYGMTQQPEIGKKLRMAVDLTVRSQNQFGGWRYEPEPVIPADLSVTVCQIMGLRAARDAGIHVPDQTRDRCLSFIRQSHNDDGSFRYQLNVGGTSTAMAAAGITSLYSAGIYGGAEIERSLKIIEQSRPGNGQASSHYYYTHYYAVQGMWHAGGEHWNQWYPAIRDDLIRRQQNDGSWAGTPSDGGTVCATAMACIILQMPLNYLPVFAA